MSSRLVLAGLIAVWSGSCLAAANTPRDYQQQLDCSSPQSQELLNAPIKPDPHDNVWVLQVLGSMGLNRHCSELQEGYFATFLERQAAQDILHEPIPELATVKDAIAWERTVEADRGDRHDGVTVDRNHLHDRMLTRAFRMEPWTPVAGDVELIRMRPGLQMLLPGIWLEPSSRDPQDARPLLSLSFVNQTARAVEWDAHFLVVRATADAPPERFFGCMVDGRYGPRYTINRVTVPPGGAVHVVCTPASAWTRGELDAVWLSRLQHEEQQWLLQGPEPDGGTYAYQKTIARLSNAQSDGRANAVIRSLSCNQRLVCVGAIAAVKGSQIYQLIVVGVPSALVGAVLVLLFSGARRAHMPGIAKRLIVAVVALGAVGVALLFANAATLGMAAVALLFVGVQVAGGLIGGMVLILLWARKSRDTTGSKPA